jgi:ethanolamine utilization protein EutN
MRIGKIIGAVTLNRRHPSLDGASFKLVVPQTWENLYGTSDKSAGEIAVFDELGAGVGSTVALSEGREAAMPFYPEVKPVDAYNAAILDHLEFDPPDTD